MDKEGEEEKEEEPEYFIHQISGWGVLVDEEKNRHLGLDVEWDMGEGKYESSWEEALQFV